MSDLANDQWARHVQNAFPDPDLFNRILSAARLDQSQLPGLFRDISTYVLSLKAQHSQEEHPNAKKRKLEGDAESRNHVIPKVEPSQYLATFFECKDVSVQVPLRKKMKIELASDRGNDRISQVRLVNGATSETEYSLSADQVEEAFCLPMPEKQARQSNFVIFPKTGVFDGSGKPAEQILFVVNETPLTGINLNGETIGEDDTCVSIAQRALEKWLRPHGKRVVTSNAAEFASSIPQSHRKGEKAYHVKAFRGSKEGFLFFLENGIVFGFKKPLAFFPFSAIDSISYTSVLQRTFNLVIAVGDGEADEVKEIEFSMLDQADFAGIDDYVKRHGLNDASMAAQRRAKAYNVNKEKKAEVKDEANGGVEEDGQTELQKAEQQLQDEEDEEEEDYEVSGGESEGEGEDSEEEEEGYEDEEVEGGGDDEEDDE